MTQGSLEQDESPVADNLALFLADPVHGFGGPGHHLGQGAPAGAVAAVGAQAFRADILTPKGLDDRTESFGVMEDAETLAARAWGGDHAFYGTSGTTQNLQALLLTVAGPGDTVLIAANEHRAALSLAATSGLDVRPYPAAVDRARDVEHGATPAAVAAALDAHPRARAVVVVSPSFFGFTCDVAAIADVVHARGLPLIVDAAWGGAFGFADVLPPCPLAQGADAMVSSVHKTLGALAQGSVIVLKGERIDPTALERTLECVQTTSPSVPVLASLDLARRAQATDGQAVWARVVAQADAARERLAAIEGVSLYDLADADPAQVAGQDRTKVVIDVSALGISGFDADEWLQAERRVSVVLSDARHLAAVFAIGTMPADVDALVDGVAALAAAARAGELRRSAPRLGYADLAAELSSHAPAAVARAAKERVPYAAAVGRIAAEIVAPTPPEVPRLSPGWVVTAATAAWLAEQEAMGAVIPDAAGERAGQVWVLKEG